MAAMRWAGWLPEVCPTCGHHDQLVMVCSAMNYATCLRLLLALAEERGVASSASLVVLPLGVEPVGQRRAGK